MFKRSPIRDPNLRGYTIGCDVDNFLGWKHERLRLVQYSRAHPECVDAGFVLASQSKFNEGMFEGVSDIAALSLCWSRRHANVPVFTRSPVRSAGFHVLDCVPFFSLFFTCRL